MTKKRLARSRKGIAVTLGLSLLAGNLPVGTAAAFAAPAEIDAPDMGRQTEPEATVAPIRSVNLNQKTEDGGYQIGGITDPYGLEEDPTKVGESYKKEWSDGKGSYVWAGSYWQEDTDEDSDADTEDEKQPVRWRVLDADTTEYSGEDGGHTMLLFSEKALDAMKYSEQVGEDKQHRGNKWADSNIRKWVNSEKADGEPTWENKEAYTQDGLFDSLFGAQEKKIVVKSVREIDNTQKQDGVAYGKDASGLSQEGREDYFFFPAVWELNSTKYGFCNREDATRYQDITCLNFEATSFAKRVAVEQLSVKERDFPMIWTRTNGDESTKASGVVGDWEVYIAGMDAPSHCISGINGDQAAGVAPMFNMDLSKVFFARAAGEDGSGYTPGAAFALTEDKSDEKNWSVCVDTGTAFTASRNGSGNVKAGGDIKVSLNAPQEGDWDQISAMLTDADGIVRAYGKVADIEGGEVKAGGETVSEVTVTVPEELPDSAYTLKVFAEKNGEDGSLTSYASQAADIAIAVAEPNVNVVKVTPAKHTVKAAGSGDETQKVEEGQDFADITYTAAEGWYFPEDYTTGIDTADSGITVKRVSSTEITVSGTPEASVTILLPKLSWEGAGARGVNWNSQAEDGSFRIAGIMDPQEAEAADSEWADGKGNYVNFGSYQQDSEEVKTPVRWRVLDADTTDYTSDGSHTMLLMSDKMIWAMEATPWNPTIRYPEGYQTEGIRAWLNSAKTTTAGSVVPKWYDAVPACQEHYIGAGFLDDAFNSAQASAIAVSVKEPDTREVPQSDGYQYNGARGGKITVDDSGLSQDGTDDRLFLLSAAEASNAAYGFYPDFDQIGSNKSRVLEGTALVENIQPYYNKSNWWLRSSDWTEEAEGTLEVSRHFGYVKGDGVLDDISSFSPDTGVVPAFNLDLSRVLFTTAKDLDDERLLPVEQVTGGKTWNLKLSAGKGFAAAAAGGDKAAAGGQFAIAVKDLGTADEGVSYDRIAAALTTEDGEVVAYGRIAGVEDGKVMAGGKEAETIYAKIPAGTDAGTYTLKVFAEQAENGGEAVQDAVDYASNVEEIPVTVVEGDYTVTVEAGKGIAVEYEDDLTQTVVAGEALAGMTFYTEEGYYLPEGYQAEGANGITVTRESETELTISGVPTGNATIVLPDAEVVPEPTEEPTEAPPTEAPTTEAPATEAPTTDVPTTDVPATEAPTTDVPVTDIPTTEAPATDIPTTDAPATGAPATEAPATDIPTTDAPATGAPATEAPATNTPGTTAPAAETPPAGEQQPSAVPDTKQPEKGQKIKGKDGASYTVTKADGGNSAVSYTKPKNTGIASINIPATVTVDGVKYKVTSIAANAFKNCKKLKKTVIGSNISTIGNAAFSGCQKLKSLTIGKNVTAIGAKAFYKCTALTKVTIPSKVKKIGKQTFFGCKKLKKITFKTAKLKKTTVGAKAFAGIAKKPSAKAPKKVRKTYQKILRAKGAKKASVK